MDETNGSKIREKETSNYIYTVQYDHLLLVKLAAVKAVRTKPMRTTLMSTKKTKAMMMIVVMAEVVCYQCKHP